MERRDSDSTSERLAEASESIGAYLAQQRKLRGITSEELSAQTRIPLRSLERLEAGSFDKDPDGFVRGFVRTVAEAVGLDPDDTVARMLSEPEPVRRGPRERRIAAGRVVLAVAAAVLVAATVGVVRIVAGAARGDAGAVAAETQEVVRRDPVRELAEAHAASLPPTPPAVGAAPAVAAVQLEGARALR